MKSFLIHFFGAIIFFVKKRPIVSFFAFVFILNILTMPFRNSSVEQKPIAKILSPAEIAEKEKQDKFIADRHQHLLMLMVAIENSAFDPDALKMGDPKYYNNGVCIPANGKNRFGAYVGFKDYCYLIDKKGKWYMRNDD